MIGWQWHHLLTYLEVTHLLTAPRNIIGLQHPGSGADCVSLYDTLKVPRLLRRRCLNEEARRLMDDATGHHQSTHWYTPPTIYNKNAVSIITTTATSGHVHVSQLLRAMPYFSSIILLYTLTKFHKNRSFIPQWCVPCSQSVNKSDFSSCHQFIHKQGRILGAPLPCEALGTYPHTAKGDRRKHSGFNISSLICC